jgi:hypothetical protein
MFNLANWVTALLVWAIIFRVCGMISVAAFFLAFALILIPPLLLKLFCQRG